MIDFDGLSLSEKKLLRRVEKALFGCLNQKDFFTVDLAVVDTETIRSFNRLNRGVDAVTDVLSFPYLEKRELPMSQTDFSDCDKVGGKVALGSIMICRKRAIEQADEYCHSYERELGFLFCHGMLHLLGFDHVDKAQEEIMTAHQREIMAAVGL